MLQELFLAFVQAATEFLPVSSSGHLALVSDLISEPNLFFITMLHVASLLAVLIFTRNEIFDLLKFDKKARKMWAYGIIATIPAALVGFLFKDFIEKSLSSFLFLGVTFIFTGLVLLSTKNFKGKGEINLKNSIFIGLLQGLALFPGISRSGMTISAGVFSGIEREKAAKFSFLLFIPLALGAMVLELGNFYFSFTLLAAFVLCFALSYLFLSLLFVVLKKDKFWMFSFYCFAVGVLSLILYFM